MLFPLHVLPVIHAFKVSRFHHVHSNSVFRDRISNAETIVIILKLFLVFGQIISISALLSYFLFCIGQRTDCYFLCPCDYDIQKRTPVSGPPLS